MKIRPKISSRQKAEKCFTNITAADLKSFTTRKNISHENALIGWGATQFWVLHLPPDTAGKVGTQRECVKKV